VLYRIGGAPPDHTAAFAGVTDMGLFRTSLWGDDNGTGTRGADSANLSRP
jgi:hypothetical protein